MKYYFLVICCLFCGTQSLLSQNLKGLWQEIEPVIGAGYAATYHFDGNGAFEYHVSEYNSLCIIRTLGGHYSIKKDSISFVIKYTVELQNEKIGNGGIACENDGWEISSGEKVKVGVDKGTKISCPFEIFTEKKDKKLYGDDPPNIDVIKINGFKFFRISENPE